MTAPRILVFFASSSAALALTMALAGCTTANLADAAPEAAVQPQPADTGLAFSAPGTYPNLNIIPKPAATQITSRQKSETTSALREKRAQVAAQGRGSTRDSSAELRRLGRSHADEALREIEGE
ncbi:MAG: hypothetical protein KL801_22285 [Mesorhizobium sp.]|nr:hypothetical protein [Mesorhizobium sp.]MBX9461761.1 hypothetical protein [Aquamicrobium sp.]